ncbi:acetylornithine deacetylase [Kangiella geojedonensis]|uniref:N-acetyl-L-citrulline deacetylase n=1 Tax=Kangiella geojedonensis TaxID=914150 RepID=A0A0F6RCW0_9GAMM|nr:acetylornithine deacetylase [Kangiella geojedonensis]AKE52773.1 Peptidase M20 [Kangiella geojedonensis]
MSLLNIFLKTKKAPTMELVKKHLRALVSFDTTNPPRKIMESGIVHYLENNVPGADIEIIDYGNGSINILVTKGQPEYLFNYHIDTVPVTEGWDTDPFDLVEKDSKLFGLGACDIKGAAACMLACIESGIDDYAVLFSSDEEHGNSVCVQSFLKESHPYKGVIVAEPTQAKAVLAHRGIITANMTFEAESGHSSEPRALDDNSNHQAAQWMVKAVNWAEQQLETSYEGLKGVCFNIGKIEGGIKPNIIAPKTELKFGLRPLPGKNVKATLDDLIESSGSKSDAVKIGFKAPSLPAKGEHNKNKLLAESLEFPIGSPVNFWTEAALFSEAGYPAIVFGPGAIEQAHTANEWVLISDLEKVLQQYWRMFNHG